MTDKTAEFRYWLAAKLASTRWPVHKDDTAETISKRLGVRPEMLDEAREVLKKMKRPTDGRLRRLGMPRARDGKTRRFMVFVEPPKEVHEDWHAYLQTKDLVSSVLLRSVVHHVMQLDWQPADLHSNRRAWRYRGKSLAQDNIRKHEFRMKTEINEALSVAMTRRAIATGVSASAFVRWAVVLVLEGWIDKTLWIVPSIGSLYKNPDEYCTEPVLKKVKE